LVIGKKSLSHECQKHSPNSEEEDTEKEKEKEKEFEYNKDSIFK